MRGLAVGDAVTIVVDSDAWSDPAFVSLKAGHVKRLTTKAALITPPPFVVMDHESTEGKTWIRGHHTEESEEGRALLVAFALSGSRAA